ncbi:MAG: protein-glutamate O-methyltransferase CheR [Nitrospirae bacterium]|nr:protein-glutamate O-methyltransferase CheR [Nitrospirota bacterium]
MASSEKGITNHIREKQDLKGILEHVHDMRGIDFNLYREATVARKIDLRLEETRAHHYKAYLDYLRANPEELDILIKTLTIRVSNFFRNPLVFELLNSFILPDLISGFRFLKIWSLGCAHGEEPYSVAILIHDLMKKEKGVLDVKILGTDICDGAIEKALKGEYPDSELLEVKKKHLDAFFQLMSHVRIAFPESRDTYRIDDEIKSMVTFECGDMLGRLKSEKSRGNAFNLMLCRNVLIYMNKTLQNEVMLHINDILTSGGYLILGESETLPEMFKKDFQQIFPGVKIFRKQPVK